MISRQSVDFVKHGGEGRGSLVVMHFRVSELLVNFERTKTIDFLFISFVVVVVVYFAFLLYRANYFPR